MKKGFDYVALGHIHKHMIFGDGNIVYPGSMINTSFKEGKTGMIIGEFENYSIVRMNTNHQNGYNVNEGTKVRIEHINLDPIKYETLYMNISDISSKEELVTKINYLEIDKNNFYKLVFKGKKDFLINEKYILDNIQWNNILRIEDETERDIDIEEISKENTLRGIFVRKILDKIAKTSKKEEIEKLENAIELVLTEIRESYENR